MNQFVKNQAEHARVYNWLKAMVVEYRFRPGEQLIIGDIADRLRVSSTPVREALIRLQAEGLMETVARRGFFAKTLTVKEIADSCEFRSLILQTTVERYIDTFDAATLQALRPPVLVDANQSATSIVAPVSGASEDRELIHYVRYVESVSEAIVSRSNNDILLQVLRNISDRTRYVHVIDLEAPERLIDTVECIEALLLALTRRDVVGAVAILKRDLHNKIVRIPFLVKEGISRAYTSPQQAAPSIDLHKMESWSAG